MERSLTLVNNLSPGDVLVMTAAIESLHRQFPGRFKTAVKTSVDELFEANPHVAQATPDFETVEMHYDLINQSNQRHCHFLHGYVEHLAKHLDIPLELQVNRPVLYLSDDEKKWMGRVQEIVGKPARYWLVNAGVKLDYTAKQWPVEHYQRVVDMLQGNVLFVQIGSAEHRHPKLRGVIDQVGKTSARELVRLAWHADGGLGPSTFLQHLCAAWDKPYVCLLGGREPATWVGYPLQHTLHTLGGLDCCKIEACWRSRVVPLGDNDDKDKNLCEHPVFTSPEVGKCMAMISPETVAAIIQNYS